MTSHSARHGRSHAIVPAWSWARARGSMCSKSLSARNSGAAGLSAALCAMHTGIIPPTINLDDPDPDCDLDYVANTARKADVRIALCNCIGFGSKNSALVIAKV